MRIVGVISGAIALLVLITEPLWSLFLLYKYMAMGGWLVWLVAAAASLWLFKQSVEYVSTLDFTRPVETAPLPEDERIEVIKYK